MYSLPPLAQMSSGRPDVLRRWLRSFTADEIQAHSKLALTAAWCAVAEGRPVETWLIAAENGTYDANRPGETDSIASAAALLRAAVSPFPESPLLVEVEPDGSEPRLPGGNKQVS